MTVWQYLFIIYPLECRQVARMIELCAYLAHERESYRDAPGGRHEFADAQRIIEEAQQGGKSD